MNQVLKMVGSVETSLGQSSRPGLRSHKELWILLYLAAHAGRDVRRRDLIELLWDEETDEPAKALSYALRNIRASLGDSEQLLTVQGRMKVDWSRIDIDLIPFDTALATQDREAAKSHYRGPLAVDLKLLNVPNRGRRWLLEQRFRRELAYHTLMGDLRSLNQAWERHQSEWSSHCSDPLPHEHELDYQQRRTAISGSLTPLWHNFDRRSGTHTPAGPRGSVCLGREADVGELVALLEQHRLVTLWGSGGIGKTTLAQHLRDWVAPRFQDRVFFVALADCAGSELVEDSVASSLGQVPSRFSLPLDHIVLKLGGQRGLLILDNAEHVLEGVQQLVTNLRLRLPALTILVTSREPLRAPKERVYEVGPLSVPGPGEVDVSTLFRASSVQLFQQRAWENRPGWTLTPEIGAAVAGICRYVSGVPLSIELAAARCRLFSPTAIEQRLEKILLELPGPAGAHPDRHRTLRAVFDWSVNLLSEPARELLAQLGVFRGSWTLEDAEVVCDEPRAMVLIEELYEASLLALERGAGEEYSGTRRFRLQEPVREYALERLGADRARMSRRHAEYFLRMARVAEPLLWGEQQRECLARLTLYQDNLRAALDWTVDAAGREAEALDLVASLRHFWVLSDRIREGRGRVEAAICLEAAPQHVRLFARALDVAAHLTAILGDTKTACGYADEAIELCQKIGDARMIAHAINAKGLVVDLPDAVSILEESLGRFRELHDLHGIASTCHDLGVMAMREDRPEAARRYLEESRSVYVRLRYPRTLATVVRSEANLAALEGDLDEARRLLQTALVKFSELHDLFRIAEVFEDLGLVEYRAGRGPSAVMLFAAASRLRNMLGAPEFGEGRTRFGDQVELSSGLEPGEFARLWWSGWHAELQNLVDFALALRP